jgi:hypothetical protein
MSYTTTRESELNKLAQVYGREANALTGDAGQFTEFTIESARAKVIEARRMLEDAEGRVALATADLQRDIEVRRERGEDVSLLERRLEEPETPSMAQLGPGQAGMDPEQQRQQEQARKERDQREGRNEQLDERHQREREQHERQQSQQQERQQGQQPGQQGQQGQPQGRQPQQPPQPSAPRPRR